MKVFGTKKMLPHLKELSLKQAISITKFPFSQT